MQKRWPAAAALFLVGVLALWIAVRAGWTTDVDADLVRSSHGWADGHPALVDAAKAVSLVFGPSALRILAVVVLAVCLARRRWVVAAYVGVVAVGGTAVVGAAKWAAGRPRPAFAHPLATAVGSAFPSGHAFAAAAGAGVALVLLSPRLRRPGRLALRITVVLVAISVGVTRVLLGVHFPTDVVAGWLLGACWFAAATGGFRPALQPTVRAGRRAPSSSTPA